MGMFDDTRGIIPLYADYAKVPQGQEGMLVAVGTKEMYTVCSYRDGKGVPVEVANRPRKFESGATRDSDTNKLDFEGFLSLLALIRFAEYMHSNRMQSDVICVMGRGLFQDYTEDSP